MPFWLSIVVAAVGFVIRRTLEETPAFEQEVAHDERRRAAAGRLVPDHWARCAPGGRAPRVIASVSTIFSVYALSYAVNTIGLDSTHHAVGRRSLANVAP